MVIHFNGETLWTFLFLQAYVVTQSPLQDLKQNLLESTPETNGYTLEII